VRHYSAEFYLDSGVRWRSSLGFGDEESISKNKETISNPAIAAPIIICGPISFVCVSDLNFSTQRSSPVVHSFGRPLLSGRPQTP
jgi:hypothetical protein